MNTQELIDSIQDLIPLARLAIPTLTGSQLMAIEIVERAEKLLDLYEAAKEKSNG